MISSLFFVCVVATCVIGQDLPPLVTENVSSGLASGSAILKSAESSGTGAKDIMLVCAALRDNGTMVTAMKASGIESGLKTSGPVTIFAPNNTAFAKLPPGLVDQLLKPENVAILSKVISYHIVRGNIDIASVREAIKAGKGRAVYTTLSGNKLIATLEDNKIRLTDDGNNACFITTADLKASNGIVHVLDKVAIPR
jgi:uncharacterized surface protein with fasciclin (FAS1) repeats